MRCTTLFSTFFLFFLVLRLVSPLFHFFPSSFFFCILLLAPATVPGWCVSCVCRVACRPWSLAARGFRFPVGAKVEGIFRFFSTFLFLYVV